MPIWLHLLLSNVSQFVGVLATVAATFVVMWSINPDWTPRFYVIIPAFIAGWLVPRLVFKFIIPARCPACGGRAIYQAGRPITYHCRACGHVHATRVSSYR